MSRSILEREIAQRVNVTQAKLMAHDRGVVLGFLLSLVPIFPIPLVGLALGLFHARAHRAGKLSEFDYRLARRGAWFAAVNGVLSIGLLLLLVHLVSTFDWHAVLTYGPRRVLEMFFWMTRQSTQREETSI